jgi:hypothetical protein
LYNRETGFAQKKGIEVLNILSYDENIHIFRSQAEIRGSPRERRTRLRVRIIRKNGAVFVIRPEKVRRSPLDVPGIDLNLSARDIVDLVREGRDRPYDASE